MKRKISLTLLLVLCFSLLMTAFVGAQEAEFDKSEFTTYVGEEFNATTAPTISIKLQELIYELSEDGTYYTVTGTSTLLYSSTFEVPTTYKEKEVRYVNLSVLKANAKITVPISVQVLDQDNIYTLEEANTIFDLDGTLSEDGTTYIFDNFGSLVLDSTKVTFIATNTYIYKGQPVFELGDGYYILDENGLTDVSEYRIFFIDSSLPDFVIDILEFFVDILEPPYTWIINLF